MRRAWTGWVSIIAAMVLAVAAHAQDQQGPSVPTVLLDLGFNGRLPAERWAPVRVVVSALDEPVQAVARIRIDTSGGDTLTTILPVATTPGRETIVETTVWIPPSIASLRVELISEGGSVIASSAYGAVAGALSIAFDPPSTMPIILGVGSPSLRMAFGHDNYEREFVGAAAEQLRARTAVARVASAVPPAVGLPPWLPTDPMAFQGLAAVVIDGALAARLEPDGLRALREWVISGGRLLIANADNNAIQLILSNYAPDRLVIGQAQEAILPRSLGGPGDIVARLFDPATLPAGWKAPRETGRLVAHGPVGLGEVFVVGFDPDTLADDDLIAATETAWHGTLAVQIEDRLELGRAALGGGAWDVQSVPSAALIAGLNWVSRAPAVGTGAFLAIFAMMLALAITLGPIDRFLLKRLRSLHRWWLTALAWIALATVGAWLVPTKVRSGPTTVGNIRVIDAWGQPGGPTHAWQTTVSGIFLNRSATIQLDDIESGAWLSPVVHPWQYTNLGSLTQLDTGQAPQPQPTNARLWTIRNFQQHGPTPPPFTARFYADEAGYELRLEGAAALNVESLAVRLSGQWLRFRSNNEASSRDGTRVLRASRTDLALEPPRSFDLRTITEGRYGAMSFVYDDVPRRPPPILSTQLPGARDRSPGFEVLSNTDDWAVVYAAWTDDTPLIASAVGESFDTTWVCRLAIPVEPMP